MNTSTRNILSTVTGLVFIAYVACATTTAGSVSTLAVLGTSGLVAWALVHLIVFDLAPRTAETRTPRPTAVRCVRTPIAIRFPRVGALRPHAA